MIHTTIKLYFHLHLQFTFHTVTEVTSTKHRAWTSVVYSISYPIGTLLLALIAYEVQNWRSLQACLTLPAFILIIHCV